MFGNKGRFGARRPLNQALLGAGAAGAAVAPSVALAGVAAPPLLSLAPLVMLLTLVGTFHVALLFVGFSVFRLHEAYPWLEPFKGPLLTSMATLAGLLVRVVSMRSYGARMRELKLLALAATALAIAFGAMFYGASSGLLGAAMVLSFLVALLAWAALLNKSLPGGWPLEMKLFFLFFAWASITVIFAKDTSISLFVWSNALWKVAVMCIALAWLARRPSDFAAASRLFVTFGGLIAAVAISNKLNGVGLVEGTRVTIASDLPGGSALGDPNDLALVLLFPLGLAFGSALMERGPARLFSAAIALLLLVAIVFTQSRGGLLGVIAVAGAIGAWRIQSKTVLIALGLIAALGLAVFAGISDRRSGGYSEYSGGGIDESAEGRLVAWGAAVSMTRYNPVTGVGVGNFPDQFQYHAPDWWERRKAVHSAWFEAFSETGLPGGALFIALVLAAFAAARRNLIQARAFGASPAVLGVAIGLMGGIAGFAVSGSFLSQAFSWQLYLQLALIAGLSVWLKGQQSQYKDRAS